MTTISNAATKAAETTASPLPPHPTRRKTLNRPNGMSTTATTYKGNVNITEDEDYNY